MVRQAPWQGAVKTAAVGAVLGLSDLGSAAWLCDPVAKRRGVVTYPRIAGDDCQPSRGRTQEFGGCQVDRVQRPDRLDGKRPSGSRQHGL